MSARYLGGCYCRALRYLVSGKPLAQALCYCRPCQHMAGGGPNRFVVFPSAGFRYTEGRAKAFIKPDLAAAVTREFCGTCGTQILTKRPDMPNAVVLKVGTLDEPSRFGHPRAAICTSDARPFHDLPSDIPRFEGIPPQRE